ncbi:LacI family DNA-binding transcriptional regulator [Flavobacterium seoulense]|uniref:LacI family transcriptional regulator n=1 Tax=Flavobacterium seoulense TaxID=1492738 RepID=A0A066WP59_9FLAO|nr:LacI family DNA-binding transcriptional regulator [Flavobacterium seoulense]KDN55827.1 LacI family transcriptional regulator [Flavobacterium seoulense]
MTEKTTIYDIAKELNITAATVSRALNNNPKISQSTRKLVLETANRMNYKQNRLALALRSGKSNNVGVIVPRINTNFFASVIRGIEESLHPEGYQVIICQTHENENREIENINTLLNAQVDGILMSISNLPDENNHYIERVVQKNIPLVFFDRKKEIKHVSSVTIDDYQASYQTTQHLLEQGCDKIAYFSGDRSLEIYEDRYRGYEKALLDNNIPINKDYIITIKSNVVEGREAVEKLLALDNPPNAIFSTSDFAALGAIQKLKEHDIKIPEDFCVFGFGNEPFTKFMELSISTVDQSPVEMGKMAAQVFLDKINNVDKKKSGKTVVLMPKLLIRQSSTRI